jgi:hypothetical protein
MVTVRLVEAQAPPSLGDVAGDLMEELAALGAAHDPYPTYERIRREWPVAETFGAVSLLRYGDVERILRHPRVSSDDRHSGTHEQLRAADRLGPDYLSQMDTRSFLHRDPPDHTRLRRLVTKAFTGARIEAMRPFVQALVDDLIDASAGPADFDLVADLAYPLPVAVISALIGVPPEDRPIVESWPRAQLCCSFEPGSLVAARQAQAAAGSAHVEPDRIQAQLTGYFDDLIERRRAQPGQDLVSALIAAEEQGERLSVDEVNATLRLLFVAGYETTVNLIANGMLALLRHPHQFEALRDDASLAAGAVEETLRYDTPLQFTRRIALVDLDIGGYRLARGTTMLLWLAAANRDPDRFADPDRFDITRGANHHLAFGSGIHACLGGPLARLQGVTVFRTLARRLVDAELQADPPPYRCDAFHAIAELPITFRGLKPPAVTNFMEER